MNNRTAGIYLVKIDEYEYVGQSVNIEERVRRHLLNLDKDRHCNMYMQYIYNTYNTFTYKILHVATEETYTQLRDLEQQYISTSLNNLNLLPASFFSQSHRDNISKGLKSSSKNKIALAKAIAIASKLDRSEAQLNHASKCASWFQTPEAKEKRINSFKTSEAYKLSRLTGAAKRVGLKKPESSILRGINAGCADLNVYTFKHKLTEELFTGTRYEFASKINTTSKQLSGLIQKVDQSYHKWILL